MIRGTNIIASVIILAAVLPLAACSGGTDDINTNENTAAAPISSSKPAVEVINFQGYSVNVREFASLISFFEELTFNQTELEAAEDIFSATEGYNEKALYDLYVFYDSLTDSEAAQLYAAVLENL